MKLKNLLFSNRGNGNKEIANVCQRFLCVVKELGHNLGQQSIILDFGCGNGELVNEFRKRGFFAFGCDLNFKEGPHVSYMQEKRIIRLFNKDPYTLPFVDNTFDFVLSNQVFEHVKNYSSALSEITRVLKPGGISFNIFPPRYKIIEPHVKVPFATIIKGY